MTDNVIAALLLGCLCLTAGILACAATMAIAGALGASDAAALMSGAAVAISVVLLCLHVALKER